MEREVQPVGGQLPPAASCCESDHDERARERLLRAAADVFDRKGYAGASVREIVEQAGITKPVLYYHYGSKEGMLLAILEEGAKLFQAGLARGVQSPGTARQRLQGLCDEMFALFRHNVSAVRVAHAVFFGPRDALPPFDFEKFDGALRAAIRSVVEDGMAAGEIRRAPVADVVTAITGVIALFTDIELTPNAVTLTLDDVHRVLDLIFEGLVPARDKEN
ncbi:MAG: TetR family transcriptional regulator [Bacteroidales bacterium]